VIEVEVQNETYQTQQVLRFAAVPRIGEGVHMLDRNGFWICFDVIDVWYQKAPYGDVWTPYIHVRLTPPDAVDSDADYRNGHDHPSSPNALS
jgi:hypothetical protein